MGWIDEVNNLAPETKSLWSDNYCVGMGLLVEDSRGDEVSVVNCGNINNDNYVSCVKLSIQTTK